MKDKLLFSTSAYNIIKNDKQRNNLSHAYLVFCQDDKSLRYYLKELGKLIMSAEGENDERLFRLIDGEKHSDVTIYPELGKKISVSDIDSLVENSFIKPLESTTRLFIIADGGQMNVQSQNKLLKTLEEPPQNVCILIGATGEHKLLPTIRSRAKILNIPEFSDKQIFEALKDGFTDEERLRTAISLSGGKAGEVESYYYNQDAIKMRKFVLTLLKEMKSSKDVLRYSSTINKDNLKDFMSILAVIMRDFLSVKEGGEPVSLTQTEVEELREYIDSFRTGAIVNILDKINYYDKAIYFNANVNMTADGILLTILEEKYKWQKL